MSLMRALLMRHRTLALFLVMAALCMKVVVPAGFMIGQNSMTLTIELCHDGLGKTVTKQVVIPIKGDTNESSGKQGKGECPFASLSMASMASTDASLLALALAFILALGIAPAPITLPKHASHLRPPLRGPPVLA